MLLLKSPQILPTGLPTGLLYHPGDRRTLMRSLGILLLAASGAAATADESLRSEFQTQVQPFLSKYCARCHGSTRQEAKFDLSPYDSVQAVSGDLKHWKLIGERIAAGEMPPEDTQPQPTAAERQQLLAWLKRVRRREAERLAGDPGVVLARRLSNAEYDYTIEDLTGQSIRPTREFPVDPANEAGFSNSGESLAMTPALLKKYFAAARLVADHLVFGPETLTFAPHPVVTDSDRDKYCVQRIVAFYRRQPVDYADYFWAAWQYRHRDKPQQKLEACARAARVSPKYLQTVWDVLTDQQDDAGPLADLRARWRQLPGEEAGERAVRDGCRELSEFVRTQRQALVPPLDKSPIEGLKRTLQPAILWINRQMAGQRQRGVLPAAEGPPAGDEQRETERAAIARFCRVFPDQFFVSERGRVFLDPKAQNKGRYLSAGFHLMVGYFRDDAPLYDLVLDADGQHELDALWRELNLVTRAPLRQFRDFVYFERAESTRYLTFPEFDFARGEDDDITSPEKMERLGRLFVDRARQDGIRPAAVQILAEYFRDLNAAVRRVEADRDAAEAKHLAAALEFAQRAWRRPLAPADREELTAFYQELRTREQLSHEDALRDLLVSVLMSPRFSYRITPPPAGTQARPLSDFALASRLSYFLWSSLPDETLWARAEAGDLHNPDVLRQQVRRMLRDPRSVRLATEFGGQWLDFRQFQQHNGVDRDRFPEFNDALREAMYQEPIHFLHDLIRRDGSVFELLEGQHTFVNPVLAAHYGFERPAEPPGEPAPGEATVEWWRVARADQAGRGGILPMAVFLTKNAPGRRTSPVKRGYWVVRRVLGEVIPAPPADVPELPADESRLGERSLRDVLAAHREQASCAGCHRRFDAIGLAFEGYGPIGERRRRDLGGRPVDDRADFPDGTSGTGLAGLQQYLRTARRDDYLETLCRKLFAYGLSRSLQLSDDLAVETFRRQLAGDQFRFGRLVEEIVTSPQFLTRRGAGELPPQRSVE